MVSEMSKSGTMESKSCRPESEAKLDHPLDMVGVVSSILAAPTNKQELAREARKHGQQLASNSDPTPTTPGQQVGGKLRRMNPQPQWVHPPSPKTYLYTSWSAQQSGGGIEHHYEPDGMPGAEPWQDNKGIWFWVSP
jgi:hypothetical protein